MYKVIVDAFGDSDRLQIVEQDDPIPTGNQVRVKLTSIGMNHADLMARRGEYKLSSGKPPFTPGIEGGGYIDAVGGQVKSRQLGQRVLLSLDAPYLNGLGEGTYRSHLLVPEDKTVLAPDALPDEQLGAIWLPYLTAWGCLVWRQQLQSGQTVLLPAASSSVAIAAAQVVKHYGGIAIGTTTSPAKLETLQNMATAPYTHLVVTCKADWWREVKRLTGGQGVDVIFDPVAAGDFLNQEIRLLANGGTLWIYGLLGQADTVDVSPLIRKSASLRGWLLNVISGTDGERSAYRHLLSGLENQVYQLPVAGIFSLRDVRQAHDAMEQGKHIGKLILVP